MALDNIVEQKRALFAALDQLEKTVSELDDKNGQMHERLSCIRNDEPTAPCQGEGLDKLPTFPPVRERINKVTAQIQRINQNLGYNLRTIEI